MTAGLRGVHMQAVQPLNRYTIEARYPGDWDPIDRPEADRAVATARSVRETIHASLPSNLLSGVE